MVPPEEFDPGLLERVQGRIRAVLGPTWDRIDTADRRGQLARPQNPNRHILATIYENVGRFSLDEVMARYPGRLPDLLALTAMANILERSREYKVFPEIIHLRFC